MVFCLRLIRHPFFERKVCEWQFSFGIRDRPDAVTGIRLALPNTQNTGPVLPVSPVRDLRAVAGKSGGGCSGGWTRHSFWPHPTAKKRRSIDVRKIDVSLVDEVIEWL